MAYPDEPGLWRARTDGAAPRAMPDNLVRASQSGVGMLSGGLPDGTTGLQGAALGNGAREDPSGARLLRGEPVVPRALQCCLSPEAPDRDERCVDRDQGQLQQAVR